MWIKDIFTKRKPNHLIVYIIYKKNEAFLYKFLSKFTYSVGPFETLDDTIEGIKKFIEKYPNKLNQINITTYGTGKKLIQTKESNEKIFEVVDSLRPLMSEETKLMFTTCFSGVSHRKVVEMSEYLGGIEVSAMNGPYGLNNPMTKCKCKNIGYSKSVVSTLPLSKNGMLVDEKLIVDIVRRGEGEEINWATSGMAYEYNKIVNNDGICYKGKQPYTLLKSIRNYLFNIQD
jgi:hypothetical protein